MSELFTLIFGITLCSFIMTSVLCLLSIHSDREVFTRRSRVLFMVSLGLFIAAGFFRYRITSVGEFIDATRTIWGYFYFIALVLLVILSLLHFSRWKEQWKSISAIALPFITVLLFVSIPFIGSGRTMQVDLEHGLLPVHIIVAITGEIFFFLSFCGSLLFLVMEGQLKKRASMKFINRLPNLEVIERFSAWALQRSLLILSAGLLIGIVLVWMKYGSSFLATPKEVIVYLSWAAILALVVLGNGRVLSRHRLHQLNLAMFLVIILVYILTVILVRSGFHSYQ